MAGNSNSGAHLRGERLPGSGRAKGKQNYKTIMMDEIMTDMGFKEKIENGTFITPAIFWATILNDPLKDDSIKHEVAKAMAPFFYKKQPQVVEQNITTSDENGFTISVINPKNM